MPDIKEAFAPTVEAHAWCLSAIEECEELVGVALRGREFRYKFRSIAGGRTRLLMMVDRLSRAESSPLRRKASEALTLTRHSFDQAMHSAHAALGHPYKKSRNYPWGESERDCSRRIDTWSIDPRLKDTLLGLQPWPSGAGRDGGNLRIRELARITNRKHDVGVSAGIDIASLKIKEIYVKKAKFFGLYGVVAVDRNGEVPIADFDGDVRFKLPIAAPFICVLDDPTLSAPIGISTGLRSFLKAAEDAAVALSARCEEIMRV